MYGQIFAALLVWVPTEFDKLIDRIKSAYEIARGENEKKALEMPPIQE